jgi:hypothetical protein
VPARQMAYNRPTIWVQEMSAAGAVAYRKRDTYHAIWAILRVAKPNTTTLANAL